MPEEIEVDVLFAMFKYLKTRTYSHVCVDNSLCLETPWLKSSAVSDGE